MTFSRVCGLSSIAHIPLTSRSPFPLPIHPSSFNGMIDIARLRLRAKGAPLHGQGANCIQHAAVLQLIKEESR